MTNFRQDWEDEEREELRRTHRRGCIAIVIAWLMALALLATGCKKVQAVVAPQVKTITERDTLTLQLHDSVYITVREFVKGDTVRKDSTVYRYIYRDINKVEYVTKLDSVPYPVEVQVPVRVRNWYDKATSWGFWLLLIAFFVCMAFKIAKWYLTRRV
ncbi:MAG: hypothetical protein IIW86_04070 [Clostridia bacterium]|nr:hypothetical protein [Clostridia bacterium]